MNGISDEKTRNFRNEIIILEKQGSTINEHDLYTANPLVFYLLITLLFRPPIFKFTLKIQANHVFFKGEIALLTKS